MTFGTLVAGMTTQQRLRDAEDRVARAGNTLKRMRQSHQAPAEDSPAMTKAVEAVRLAERHLARCRIAATGVAR